MVSIGLNTLLTQFLVSFRSRLRQQQKEISELRQLQQQLSKGRAITNVDLFNRIADGSSSQRPKVEIRVQEVMDMEAKDYSPFEYQERLVDRLGSKVQ